MADTQGFPNSVLNDATGNTPEVAPDLEIKNRSIGSIDQAFSVCETLVNDWKKGILNAARITAKINGERPYNQKKLENAGKGWKTNISTGFLATECGKVSPRLFMPIKTAKYLTAASLPAGHPNGLEKTNHFRQVLTNAVRGWDKFNPYIRGLAREVGTYGFAHNVWFDEYEWRPTLMRMDKGFVPQGTEIMEEPQFFMAKWDYSPSELLNLLQSSLDSGRTEWKKDNVIQAVNGAIPPPVDATYPEARSYEDLMRQATWAFSYTKGAKKIRTWHLFAKEATGMVSHYVLLADSGVSSNAQGSPGASAKLLYEKLDQYQSMADAVATTVFEYGDGTVHGSWGAGQILYDLAAQVEKIRCDSIDNMRLTNKIKANVPDAKNFNDVKLTVDDQMVIISGAQFAGNTSAMGADIEGYELLDAKLTQLAQQKIGAFVPPIPLQPSDVKAAQINAAMSKEKELQEAMLENWLVQWAMIMRTIARRICDPNSPDETAQRVVAELSKKLTIEEITELASQLPVKSVMDFTEYRATQKALFAQSVMNNPLFKQGAAARIMAEGAGDEAFVDEIVVPQGDQTDVLVAQREQLKENAAMAIGHAVPVVPSDNDWVHMQTLKPDLGKLLVSPQPNIPMIDISLAHYTAHFVQGVNKKQIPDQSINEEKSWIASATKTVEALKQSEQIRRVAAASGVPPDQLAASAQQSQEQQ